MARARKTDEPKKVSDDVSHWLSEIEAAKKREQDYRTEGKRIRCIYSGEKKDSTPFNVLYSNTEVLAPSLYSMVPRPVVERRFKDNDALGKASAIAGQRALEFMLDTNMDGYDTFNDSMKASVLDGLLPGRGITGVKYDADTEGEVKKSELVCPEIISWKKVGFGYASKWARLPWMYFEFDVDKDEATRLFGEKIAGEIEYTTQQDEEKEGRDPEKATGERKVATVYQIWDKDGGRQVRWISRHYTDNYLKVEDDPLGLTGFFKIPRPLQFVEKTDDMVPTALYTLYENQAEELNNITRRINKIVSAMKARGVYDAALGSDIEDLLDGDDNELIPTEKGNSLAAERGLAGAIFFMPLEILQSTLQQLYIAREQCKQVIYEIMGISDIVRGASKASETLGAQQLKSQWGVLRLKNKQAEVQRYARDLLRMMLEVAAGKFSQETWAKMTGLPYLTDLQAQQLQAQMMAMQQQAQTIQAQAARTGQPIPPEVAQQAQQQMQALQQQLQSPKWSDILKLLQDDLQRAYRIDIETNSTIEPEAAEDQKNITELMTAMGQFVQGVGPMVQTGVMPMEVAKSMLLAITRRFRFGRDIEDMIEQMQAPPPQDNGEKQKAAQQIMQLTQDKNASDAKSQQLQTQLTASQQEKVLLQRSHELDLKEKDLGYQQDVFNIEKKVAHDSVTRNANSALKELDSKKQISAAENKAAQASQTVSKTVDNKMGQSVQALQSVIQQMGEQHAALLQTVASQSEDLKNLAKAVTAPRRRKAIRDKEGNIVETQDEVLGDTVQ